MNTQDEDSSVDHMSPKEYRDSLKTEALKAGQFLADQMPGVEVCNGENHTNAFLNLHDVLDGLECRMQQYQEETGTSPLSHDEVADAWVELDYELCPYFLEDAEEQAAETPETFWIEKIEVRANLMPGEFVKVCFADKADSHPGERMWLKVKKRFDKGDGVSYSGTLANEPLFFDLALDDLVYFGPEHVYAIEDTPE